jgi:hypothetical protein
MSVWVNSDAHPYAISQEQTLVHGETESTRPEFTSDSPDSDLREGPLVPPLRSPAILHDDLYAIGSQFYTPYSVAHVGSVEEDGGHTSTLELLQNELSIPAHTTPNTSQLFHTSIHREATTSVPVDLGSYESSIRLSRGSDTFRNPEMFSYDDYTLMQESCILTRSPADYIKRKLGGISNMHRKHTC